MGCASSNPSPVQGGSYPNISRKGKVHEDSANNNNHRHHQSGSLFREDCLSLGSATSDSSRPATPFSRPMTAKIAQRPSTTTIFEDASRGSLSNMKKSNSVSADPSAFLSVRSHSNGGSYNPSIKDESISLSSSARSRKSQHLPEDPSSSGSGGQPQQHPPNSMRKLSGKMNGADEEDIRQLKAFLKKKGL